MKDIRASRGAGHEAWRLATQTEVDAVRDAESFETVSAADQKKIRFSEVLPVKLVTGVKHDAATGHIKRRCGSWSAEASNRKTSTIKGEANVPPGFSHGKQAKRRTATIGPRTQDLHLANAAEAQNMKTKFS